MEPVTFTIEPVPATKPGIFGPTKIMYQPDPIAIDPDTGDVTYIDPILVAAPNDTPTILLGFSESPGSGIIKLGMYPWLKDPDQAASLYPVFEFGDGVIASLAFSVS